MVLERTKDNATPGYDGFCRDRGLERQLGRALRFKVPREGVTVVDDLVRGEVRFVNSTIDDFVVAKSNGDPLFVLAGVVDDREMRISHVIRAEEHLPTTPKAVLLWEALGTDELPLPAYAHLPVLVNEKRQKISKRRDRVAIEDYRAQGFLPEAMVNYLALLGWSPGDGREFFSLDELVSEFDLGNVNHSPAFFDQQKLLHFNGVYLRALPVDEFVERCRRWAAEDAPWRGRGRLRLAGVRAARPARPRAGGDTCRRRRALVEFLFAPEFVSRGRLVQQGDREGRRGGIDPRRGPRAARRAAPSRPRRCGPRSQSSARSGDASSARCRRRSGWPPSGAASACPCSSRSRCSGRDRTLERLDAAIARLSAVQAPARLSSRQFAGRRRSHRFGQTAAPVTMTAAHSGVV